MLHVFVGNKRHVWHNVRRARTFMQARWRPLFALGVVTAQMTYFSFILFPPPPREPDEPALLSELPVSRYRV